jgi:putative transposase
MTESGAWRDGRCPVPNLGTTQRSSLQNMEEIGRKHPIHLDVHDRRDTPIIVFLTVCTKGRKPILASSEAQVLLIAAWRTAKKWRVGRYVIMPDHVHLFCAPAESETQPLLQWVKYWKSVAARTWTNPVESPIWQRHFWDTQLRRSESYDQKWQYVVENPVRAGLVARSEDWSFQGKLNELRW